MRATSLGIGLLMLAPLVLGEFGAYQMATYLLYACAAVGLGLCWGHAGFLPLGQALFFGLPAYLSGLALVRFEGNLWLWLALPCFALVSGLLAYGIGRLVFRSSGQSGPYFSMITLALSLLAFQVANSWQSVTGGFNGLANIPALPGLDGYVANYYVAAAALLGVMLIAHGLVKAPLGLLWSALSQNERRVALLGFDTRRLKALAFGIGGFFAGLGGAFYAPQQGLVTPQLIGLMLSTDLVIWAAVGGRGSLLGPVIGVVLVGALSTELKTHLPYWEVVIALLFIGVVLVVPRGAVALLKPLERWWSPRRPAGTAVLAPDLRRAPATLPTLRLADARASIGEVTLVNGLTMTIDGPGVFCLIGPNGAGKTSTFNLVTGELPSSSGKLHMLGQSTRTLTTHAIARLGIARKLQIPSIFAGLSIEQNLHIALWVGRLSRLGMLDHRAHRWTSPVLAQLVQRYPFLGETQRRASDLAHGEKQVLELAMALLTEPRLMLLDEPCAGLSPEETAQVIDLVRWSQRWFANTVLIVEHDISLVKALADRVFVLHQGALLMEGSLQDVQASPAVQAVYVGARK